MADQPDTNAASTAASTTESAAVTAGPRHRPRWFALRRPIRQWERALLGLTCIGVLLFLWWFATRQPRSEHRLIGYNVLPSIPETFGEFKSLWFDRAFTRNTITTLRRVTLGFGLACLIGVPAGILAGCFTRFEAFLTPVIIFGRNIPIAALIPLTFFIAGIAEAQKVLFIFLASVSFVIADVTQSVRDVPQRYVDTALTLGASRWQVISKVLVPLSLPTVFDSLRLLFGLAFGYIMLAEVVKIGDEEGGLGHLISVSQRQGPREHIYLIILLIPVLAYGIDRLLYWVQRELFPHRYGGYGVLRRGVHFVMDRWDDLKCFVLRRNVSADHPTS